MGVPTTDCYRARVQVRPECPDDRDAVGELHWRAFGDRGGNVVNLVDALRKTITLEAGLSIVAEDGGEIIGHVMFTTSLLDAPRRLVDVQVLSPLGVASEHQGRGVGSALVRHGLAAAAEQGAPLVFLEGDPGYYTRFGFTPGGEVGFRKPSLRIPDAAFQVVKLPSFEPWMDGTLVYADVFWRYDCVGLRAPDTLPSSSDLPRP
jgi:putative acetyltransferase